LAAAQFVKASSCEATHQGSNPGVHIICGIKKKLIGGDDINLDTRYPGHGLVWDLLPRIVLVVTNIVNGVRPKYHHGTIG
jgi:hypothetical protein